MAENILAHISGTNIFCVGTQQIIQIFNIEQIQ